MRVRHASTLCLRFRQKQLAQLAQALCRGQKRAVAAELLELAADEEPIAQRHRSVDLLDQHGLADPRVTGHKEATRTARGRVGKGRHQRCRFLLAPVQAARRAGGEGQVERLQPHRREWLIGGQRAAQLLQIVGQPRRALIAVVRFLGEQGQDQLRHAGRQPGRPLLRRHRRAGQVGMDQAKGIGAGKGRGTGGQGIEGGAERIEVGAVVDRPIHPPGLLGRQIGRRARQGTRVIEPRVLFGKGRGQIVVDDLHLQVGRPHQDVGGVQILVDDTAPVDLRHRMRQRVGDGHKALRIEVAQESRRLQGDTAEVRHGQLRRGRVVAHQTRTAGQALQPIQDALLVV
nr:hypothetical protein [Thiocapsa sp.]